MPTDDQQAKLQQDWQEICDKLQELKKLDTGLLGEGADKHRYSFRPPASREQIQAVEERLGVSLPAELAYFYSTVGDGGVGPCGGIAPVENLSLFRLDDTDAFDEKLGIPPRRRRLEPPDISAVTRLVEVTGRDWTFYASGTDQVLVSCDGPAAGSVSIFTECAGDVCYFLGPIESLAELYLRWLEHDLAMFEVARQLIMSSDDLDEVWNTSDEILEAQQQGWGERAHEFRQWYCATTGWLHFESEKDVLDWIGRVLGVDMHPTFAERELVTHHGYINFGSQLLQDRFRAARRRYLDSASAHGGPPS